VAEVAALVPPLDPVLVAAIEGAVNRQVRPLRAQLIAAEERTRLQDILGGIGYIAGLTGLVLWWRSRRPDGLQ
jgi:nickel transport protein